MQIKFLKQEGVTVTEIAQRFGISRQTIYNHLNRTDPYPKPRERRSSKLDPHKDYIQARVRDFDIPATSLLRELRSKGYDGGLTILRSFVRPLKAELIQRVTERFETRPGRQAQIDWGECGTIMVGGERKKLYLFVLVLGYSRMTYARFTTSMKLPVLQSCLKEAFSVLGIPAELLVDNMKQAVNQHDTATGTVRWNAKFLAFCDHYGTLPAACPPYWPRVKGKVERGVGYVKQSFLTGRCFTDLRDLNHQLDQWIDTVANVRDHGTTKERPIDRYREELPHLGASTAVPSWDTRPVEIRRVPADCHISYEGVLYSVDPVAVGGSVVVRASGENVGDTFSAYHDGDLVAVHRRAPKGSRSITLPEHAAAIRKITRGDGLRRTGRRKKRFTQEPIPVVQHYPLSIYEQAAQA
ncbi:IS21 family transposase [Gemmatimonadota bacterium]